MNHTTRAQRINARYDKIWNNYYDTNPTAAELTAVLGEGWAICRATAKMKARYQHCISRKTYLAAIAEAMRRRTERAAA